MPRGSSVRSPYQDARESRQVLRRLRRSSAFEILAARNENPRGDGQRAADKRRVRQLTRVRTDSDIEILGQQIDLSACHVLHEVDPWVFLHEAHDDVAKRELCRTQRRCESYDAG